MNKQVIPGVNDLATTHPHLVNEWDNDCNSVAINQVTFGSQRKVHWVCSQGHKWGAVIADRSRGFGCPYCVNIVSRAECEIRKHLENLGLSVETNILRPILLPRGPFADHCVIEHYGSHPDQRTVAYLGAVNRNVVSDRYIVAYFDR